MRRFQFRLQSVLGLREAARQQCHTRLAESCAAQQKLHARGQEIASELAGLASLASSNQAGPIDVGRLAQVERYKKALRADLRVLDEQCRELEQDIDARRQALIAADREVRLLERLRDKQLEQHRQLAASVEAKELDDLVRAPLASEQHKRSEVSERN